MLSHISLNPYLRNQSNINFKNLTFNNSNFYNNYLIRITNKIHTVKVINTNLIIVENSFIDYWISLLKMFEMSYWILKYEAF